jgi:chromosomal replication initiation ATPase DnaA
MSLLDPTPTKTVREYILDTITLRRENDALRREIDRLKADIAALQMTAKEKIREPLPTMNDVLGFVSERTLIPRHELVGTGGRGPNRVARIRHIVFWLARNHSGASMPSIGRRLGGRDHSTVLHGCRVVEAAIAAAMDGNTDHQAELGRLAMMLEADFIKRWEVNR